MLNNQASMPTLTNVAFGGNQAGQRGGGLRNANGSHAALVNCILWGNDALEGPQIDNYRSTPAISCSLAQGSGGSGANWDDSLGSDGGGNLDADPQFVAPVDAGQSPTIGGNYHLLPGSPAIDVGDNSAVTVDTDLDGNARIAGGAVDMGPYEAQYTTVLHYLPLVLKN